MTRKHGSAHPEAKGDHRPRRIYEEDPGKLPELAGCPRCGASYRDGRWTAQPAPVGAYEHTCPACLRIENDDPAGVVRLEGDFLAAHRQEIEGLLRNVEERESGEHPLKRIMAMTDEDGGLTITVADGKLAENLGRAIESAYEGQLELPSTPSEPGDLVRVGWRRD